MNWYRCDICGCYLDPGEGLTCDECLRKQEKKRIETSRHNRSESPIEEDCRQYVLTGGYEYDIV